MKNPFTKVEVGSTVQPPNGTGLALLKLFRRDGGTSIVLPAEQAEYAALAINQHERLVEYMKNNYHMDRSGSRYSCGCCLICSTSPTCWQDGCERAALLAGKPIEKETTDAEPVC